MKDYKFKLTTECGFHWDWEHVRYWQHGWKPRLLNKEWRDGVRVTVPATGVAFGPIMFFWKWS